MHVESQAGRPVDAGEKQVAEIADLVLKVTALADRYEAVGQAVGQAGPVEAQERVAALRSTALRGRSALAAIVRSS